MLVYRSLKFSSNYFVRRRHVSTKPVDGYALGATVEVLQKRGRALRSGMLSVSTLDFNVLGTLAREPSGQTA